MTEKHVVELLEKYRRAPGDIELAREKIEQWQKAGGKIAEEEVERLIRRVAELQTLIVSVERALEKLPKYQRDIIRYHSEKVPWWKIAKKVNYSPRGCQWNYNKALKVLAGSEELAKYAPKNEVGGNE